ncbi:SusC/RagA family TonB-linked outer membrane protein [Bacteroidia bacterium]|nr:SusC/RagA family TonB-linked outer membrane protein [Bacteroidia bacterium]
MSAGFAQNRTITGLVLDTKSGPIPFASVYLPGTTTGANTDINGTFSLTIPSNATVFEVSFTGYEKKQVQITAQSSYSVVLAEEATALDEVVVIGYGTQKKRDLTGAVSSVSAKDLIAKPVSNISEALQGSLAGVQVTTSEGSPDAEITIRVRGGGSITGSNAPLYIVDGFPTNSISDISPNDIQNIDVLKDASSTAIYGSRGANGVIIVTTKSGESGKISVDYNFYFGIQKIAKKLNVLKPYDYALWQYEAALLGDNMTKYNQIFGNWEDIDMYEGMEGNDWQDILFGRMGTTMNNSLSVRGGSDKTKFNFNYTNYQQKAIMMGSDFNRHNLSFKLTNNPYKRLQIDLSARYSQTAINGSGANEGGSEKGSTTETRLKHAMMFPSIPVSGSLTDPTNTDQSFGLRHPVQSVNDNDKFQKRVRMNFAGAVTYEFIDNFKLKTDVGYDQYSTDNQRFYGLTTYYIRNNVPAADQMHPAIIFENAKLQSFRNTNTLLMDFKKWLPKDHTLTFLLGEEMIMTTNESLTAEVVGFDNSFDFDLARRLSTEGKALSTSNYYSPDDNLLSFFGRVNYDYKGRYLLAATFRADGSSKFSKGHRWGYFPSVSAGWRISAEPWMKATESWLYDLKLRASYGTAGNNGIPTGQITQSYQSSTTTWVNGFDSYWAPSKVMANPDLVWETTVTNNVGLDMSFLHGKLNATLDLYLNTTKDLLILFNIPGSGYDAQYRNMGNNQNKGLELSLNYVAIEKKHYGLSFSANIGFNKNKIMSLGVMDDFFGATEWSSSEIGNDFLVATGYAVGQYYGYRNDGRYEVEDFNYNAATGVYTRKDGVVDASGVIGTLRPGSMKLKDLNNDGVIDNDDKEVIGNANPLFTGGFNIVANVWGFDIGAYFNFTYGNQIYNANKIEYTSTSKYFGNNMIDIMESGNRWNNLDATTGLLVTDPDVLTAMNANTTMWSPYMNKYVLSDWAVEDGSFLRLNTLTLGYTISPELTKKIKIQNIRFYCSAYNLFVATKYSGFDPEVSTRRKVAYTPGVDYAAYPRSRSVVFGLNLTF